ncbi:hypothetical protein ACU4GD_00980 [Cupriavidus basilensis]
MCAVIQVAEYDSQSAPGYPAHGEFANTWSADGFITECLQDAELGVGQPRARAAPGGQAPQLRQRRGSSCWTGLAIARACVPGPRCMGRSMPA